LHYVIPYTIRGTGLTGVAIEKVKHGPTGTFVASFNSPPFYGYGTLCSKTLHNANTVKAAEVDETIDEIADQDEEEESPVIEEAKIAPELEGE
jgi:hypothetical protein